MFGKINDTYIYCPGLIRAASTTADKVLSEFIHEYTPFISKNYSGLAIKNKHLPRECIILPDNTYKFLLHRDPWSRMSSLYRWGCEISHEYRKYKDVNDFISYELNTMQVTRDQYRFWSSLRWAGDMTQYNKIALYSDVNCIFDELESLFNIKLIRKKVHMTTKKTKLNTTSIDLISKIYHDEIAYFGYKYK